MYTHWMLAISLITRIDGKVFIENFCIRLPFSQFRLRGHTHSTNNNSGGDDDNDDKEGKKDSRATTNNEKLSAIYNSDSEYH